MSWLTSEHALEDIAPDGVSSAMSDSPQTEQLVRWVY